MSAKAVILHTDVKAVILSLTTMLYDKYVVNITLSFAVNCFYCNITLDLLYISLHAWYCL